VIAGSCVQREPRFVLSRGSIRSTLDDDVRSGLRAVPKSLPPKYFYDDYGSQLFDAICDAPEYYQTRTEQALLERIAADVVERERPTDLVEIGSGAARKARIVLDAMGAGRYVPIDISEQILVSSAESLLDDYSWLRVHGVVADYEQRLGGLLPAGDRRLYLFLGGTLGNFSPPAAVAFLRRIRGAMREGDSLLIGIDLVKSPVALHDAYNDAAGITAAFNLNVLRVLNHELDADFDPDGFTHVAFYRPELEQIEMHLQARAPQVAEIRKLAMRVAFADGERVCTEISRKFTRASAGVMSAAAGLRVAEWYAPENEYFALALLEPES